MEKKNIAVLFGGVSPEHEVSIKSAYNVMSVLDKEKYNVIPVYITKSGEWLLYDGEISNLLNVSIENIGYRVVLSPSTYEKGIIKFNKNKYSLIPIDLVFPVLHGSNGEDGSIQGLLQLADIKFIGCGILSSAVSFDKAYTKLLVQNLGINQVKSLILKDVEDFDEAVIEIEKTLNYPIFVKPARAGSAIGVSKTVNKEQLLEGLINAVKIDKKVILEEGYNIREIECAVLGTNDNPEVSVLGEVIADGIFYGYDEKYNNPNSKTVVPNDLTEEQTNYIQESAIKIYRTLECKGLSRIDFFLNIDSGEIYFNEINTMPGFTNISMYPKLWEETGLSYGDLLDRLISTELENGQ